MHQETSNISLIAIKLEEWNRIDNLESSIGTMTEFFKELRSKCTDQNFREKIAANPAIIRHSVGIISKVAKIKLTSSNEDDFSSQQIVPVVPKEAEGHQSSRPKCSNTSMSEKNGDNTKENTLNFALMEDRLESSPELKDEVISFIVLVLQFLANAIVQSPESQLILWQQAETLFEILLPHPERRLQEVIGAITYYTFIGCSSLQERILSNMQIISAGINTLRTANTEFWYIFFEHLVKNGSDFKAIFSNLSSVDKCTLIELIARILDDDSRVSDKKPEQEKDVNDISLSNDTIIALIKEFNKNSDFILVTTSKGRRDVDPLEVVNLLKILCKISSDPNSMHQAQSSKSLLINSVYLLRALHSASCDPSSNVSAVKKVDDVIRERPQLEASITYGLKADMIRLVGNLMYRNKGNQDFVRENKGIEIILESTCYDGRNPFIKEWSILAIRNFCDENESNQRYIGNLKKMAQLSEDFEELTGSAGKDESNLQNAVEYFSHMDS
ncbi:unnamed protein product [Bemisia tabaci]|uniref:Ataxin-10 n=1 Tax=Bemisia tabaci TaxID=7038 RepID=A0A9P0AJC9_BEMTA|nr:unnamed protein product [Bemisia tabaci]